MTFQPLQKKREEHKIGRGLKMLPNRLNSQKWPETHSHEFASAESKKKTEHKIKRSISNARVQKFTQ